MIGVAAFLLIVAVGLLAGGLAQGSAALQWGSFAASLLAALVLAVGELRRRREVPEPVQAPAADVDRPATPPAEAPVLAAAPAVGPAAPGPVRDAPAMAPAAAPEPVAAPEPELEPELDPEPVQQPATQAAAATQQPAGRSAAHSAGSAGPATGAHAVVPALGADGEPPVEEVEVTDLLVVLDLTDEVLVVDEHPRYHLAGCPHLEGAVPIPVPMDEARTDGFTPCGTCAPDHHLAARERARRAV